MTEMREAFSVFAPYRDVQKVTVFGSARTATHDPRVRAGHADRLHARRPWVDGRHRRRAGDHAGGDGGCRARPQHRRGHPPAVRAGRQSRHRRRREVRLDALLLHPQADAGEGEPGVRLPPRRVRHARRDVRAAHADPDRQGPARADRPARSARRPVLGAHRRADPGPARRARPGVAGGSPAVPRDQLLRRGGGGDRPLLRQLPLDPLRRRPPRPAPPAAADRRPARRAQRAVRPARRPWAHRAHRRRSTSSVATAITSSCRGSA